MIRATNLIGSLIQLWLQQAAGKNDDPILNSSSEVSLNMKGTRQKGLQNILRSDVDIVLAIVYCYYCLRAEQSDHHPKHPQSGQLLAAPDRSKNHC